MFDEKTLESIAHRVDKQTDDIEVGVVVNPPHIGTVVDCAISGSEMALQFILYNQRPYDYRNNPHCVVAETDEGVVVSTSFTFKPRTVALKDLHITSIKFGGELVFTGVHRFSRDGCGEGCLSHRVDVTEIYEITVLTDQLIRSATIKKLDEAIKR